MELWNCVIVELFATVSDPIPIAVTASVEQAACHRRGQVLHNDADADPDGHALS